MVTFKSVPVGTLYLDPINGYMLERVQDHPLFPGFRWVPQHRKIVAEKLGRKLESWELVHHKDHDKLNNNEDNLALTTRTEHPTKHKGLKRSAELRARMSEAAKRRCTPEWRAAVSERVKLQHQQGRFVPRGQRQ
jgi:hypothetical protein